MNLNSDRYTCITSTKEAAAAVLLQENLQHYRKVVESNVWLDYVRFLHLFWVLLAYVWTDYLQLQVEGGWQVLLHTFSFGGRGAYAALNIRLDMKGFCTYDWCSFVQGTHV